MSLVLTNVAFNWPNFLKQLTLKQLFKFDKLRASFTNSLHDRKPSFGVKIVLSGFTKEHSEELRTIFAPDLIEYAFVVRFPFRLKMYGRRVLTTRDDLDPQLGVT